MALTQFIKIDRTNQQQLLDLALRSIKFGAQHQTHYPVQVRDYPLPLQEEAASFVSLLLKHQLRGCIGTLKALYPLAESVSRNAYSAAYHDPRFRPLDQSLIDLLTIEISIVSTPTPLQVSNEEQLLRALTPHQDGLILTEGTQQATFLPSVWEQLPEPKQFLQQLKKKAGFRENYWSDKIQLQTYETFKFSSAKTELD